jgi:hypothetical protein
MREGNNTQNLNGEKKKGLGCSLDRWQRICLACARTWVPFPHCKKLCVCNKSYIKKNWGLGVVILHHPRNSGNFNRTAGPGWLDIKGRPYSKNN